RAGGSRNHRRMQSAGQRPLLSRRPRQPRAGGVVPREGARLARSRFLTPVRTHRKRAETTSRPSSLFGVLGGAEVSASASAFGVRRRSGRPCPIGLPLALSVRPSLRRSSLGGALLSGTFGSRRGIRFRFGSGAVGLRDLKLDLGLADLG